LLTKRLKTKILRCLSINHKVLKPKYITGRHLYDGMD